MDASAVKDSVHCNIAVEWLKEKEVGDLVFFDGMELFVLRHTLQGTNISPKNGILKMIFLFPRWDMLVPWRVFFFAILFWKYN